MSVLTMFDPPGNIDDFDSSEASLAARFREEWSKRVQCWFEVGKIGDRWNLERDSPRERFFSPLGVDLSTTITPPPVFWSAFPKRILDGFEPTHTRDDRLKFADEGPPHAPGNPQNEYRPSGPRGWQDEYCEWAVERNAQGKITKVTFTCENREYWETLWFISPEKVRDLYRHYLGNDSIQLDDLSLKDERTGQVVIDPDTGRPAYDTHNIWNRNNFDSDKNGIMHLISRPNNLFAEIYLAAGASILRKNANGEVTDRDILIDCSGYGEPGRNSDPRIGDYVNDLVRANNIEVALANPVGLYIEGISTNGFVLPSNAPSGVNAQDFWKVLRGPNEAILRAEFAVPSSMGFTVGDIKIDGEPIAWGAQLAERIQVKLTGLGRSANGPLPASLNCIERKVPSLPKPLLFFANGLLKKKFSQGTTDTVFLLCNEITPIGATVQVSGDGVTVTIIERSVGQSGNVILSVNVQVLQTASLGFRKVALIVAGTAAPAAPCVIEVVEAGIVSGPVPLDLTERLEDLGGIDTEKMQPYFRSIK